MKDFELLLLDGTNPSGVSMTRDILAAAALLAGRSGEAAPGQPVRQSRYTGSAGARSVVPHIAGA